jgi:hypothetical protein
MRIDRNSNTATDAQAISDFLMKIPSKPSFAYGAQLTPESSLF